MTARTKFDALVAEHLIPEFCSDETRLIDVAGFIGHSNKVTEEDAEDFLRAWNLGLPVHQGRGLYTVGTGKVREQFFWQGLKSKVPRTFTLFLEPVITIGAIARLHLDHGWPLARLAAQSSDRAFDIVATSADGITQVIAGEVKKSRREADELIACMITFGRTPHAVEPVSGRTRNAFKKVVSLRRSGAPVLWVIAPARYEMVFNITYRAAGAIHFEQTDTAALTFAPV